MATNALRVRGSRARTHTISCKKTLAMQKIVAPGTKDNKNSEGAICSQKQQHHVQTSNSNPLDGLLSISCAQISSHSKANHSPTTDKKTIEEIEEIPPVKSIEKPSDLKINATPRQQSTENLTAKVNGKPPGGRLSGEGTTSKANLKRSDSEINTSRSVAVIPGSLRPPNTVTGCRYVQSYLVCGNNGIKLVSDVLDKWKWHRLADKTSTSFTMKWSELRQSIDFHAYRESEQMVNHYPNSTLLTTKIGLLESLRQHKAVLQHLRLHMNQMVPETYRMDVPTEREEFFQTYKSEELWICKPTGANQGKGIFLVTNLKQLEEKLQTDERNCPQSRRPTPRIVQRYISKPLLLEDRKFDIRVFLLFVSGGKDQLLAFYHHGYIRLSCLPYDTSSSDMIVHLTNQFVQKKHPNYQDIKENTVWDFDKFQSYLTEHEKLPSDWVEKTLKHQIKRVMLGLHHSVRHKLEQRIGYFELFGLDFMLDSDHHLWLIEVNVNPAMNTNCDVLMNILPGLIEETLGIAIEVWSKSRRSRPVFPIDAQKSYERIHPL